jgi:hypothetical protein
MKKYKTLGATALLATTIVLVAFTTLKKETPHRTIPKGCVFRTVMGEESSDSSFIYKTPLSTLAAINEGLHWLSKAQNENGGWGAGSHARQDIIDPHAVHTDPATTSMVAMALLRSGSTLTRGTYSVQLKKALMHLLEATESASANSYTITDQTGTQIQTKLGANIDVILAAQFFSNIMDHLDHDAMLKARVKKCLSTCVQKIQRAQDRDGSTAGAGWAGVLQSSFANNALESAQLQEVVVDEKALEKSREYQQKNVDTKTGEVKTDRGAGIVLYAVSSSSRASAKQARKAFEKMELAKRDGRLPKSAPVTAENLEKIGFTKDDALEYSTAYDVYQSAKTQAQREDVMSGFGNNGGEEFLSYLQTGESLIIGKDDSWKSWYDNMCGRLIKIQNDNGSWSGHHCITSPVFCTATCILILTVNNDANKLVKN